MREVLEACKLIRQAIGLVMQRYEMNEERAFQYLLRASSTSIIKLRDIAAERVQNANDRFGTPPPQR
jgi:AmiR/NasT family two-component response regulator